MNKDTAGISKPLPTSSLCQSERHPEREGLQLPCLHSSGAGSTLQEVRVVPYNHSLPRGGRLLARPRAAQRDDGTHVMQHHLADTASYPPKNLEEL